MKPRIVDPKISQQMREQINTAGRLATRAVNKATTILSNDCVLSFDTSFGEITQELPNARTRPGQELFIENTGNKLLRIGSNIVNANATLHLISTGTDWIILGG
jgi:hypothetical protein